MMPDAPRQCCHITDLLPAYARAGLLAPEREMVREHLLTCADCRTELAFYQALGTAAQAEMAALPVPPLALLDAVWAEADATSSARPFTARVRAVSRRVAFLTQLARAQVPLVPASVWAASAAAMVVALVLAMLWRGGAYPPFLLGILLVPVTATGVAFLYDPANEPGLEIALAAPTSPRLVLFSRFLMVYVYNTGLAVGASLFLTVAQRANFALLASYWLGPMLLMTGASLLASLLWSATAGAAVVAGFWCLRILGLVLVPLLGHDTGATALLTVPWQTNTLCLLIALLVVMAAVLVVPRDVAARSSSS